MNIELISVILIITLFIICEFIKEWIMEDKEILKEALHYFASMYGFTLSKYADDGNIEYSCNGYVVDEDTIKVLVQAKKLIDWWE